MKLAQSLTSQNNIHPSLTEYLAETPQKQQNGEMISYLANLGLIASHNPDIARMIVQELRDQRNYLKLIASENYSSICSQVTMGNLLTDKYAEGFPNHRFYSGCDNIDEIESLACQEAKELFEAEHAYVQPHSGADANLIAFWAILHTRVGTIALEKFPGKKINDLTHEEWSLFRKELGNHKLLALDYYSGGHLTHGYRFNVSAQMFDCHSYCVRPDTGLLDYDAIEKQALELKPLILLTGYSAYPRAIDFARMRAIADKIGAVFMVDMAHFAGLVAGKVFTGTSNPIPHAHIVTSTTHKTLRGPRGGLILCTEEFREQVDKGCPLVIGGPLPHVMAAKAVSFREARLPEFKTYASKIQENARALAAACISEGMTVATGGTDNHLLLLDVRQFGLNGRQAETAVRASGITLNRNSLPADPNGPWFTSGLRIGTPAVTTLGMGVNEMKEIAKALKLVLGNAKPETIKTGKDAGKPSQSKVALDPEAQNKAQALVDSLLARFPVYPSLNVDYLVKHFL
jgi:glycine hydroxymethyltransferase